MFLSVYGVIVDKINQIGDAFYYIFYSLGRSCFRKGIYGS